MIHDKSKTLDIGKAYWSKLKLEKVQNIHLLDYIDAVLENNEDNFNLSLAKKRVMKRKQEKCLYSRSKFEIDRSTSATSVRDKRVLQTQNSLQFWDNIVICNDIKVVNLNNALIYIIAKDNGEVLCCRRVAGVFKVHKLLVTNDTSSITCLEASAHNLPYFLAATESGTVNLCSLHEMRVLLTLDCRNVTPTEMERCKSDHKGRYISSVQSSNSARCTEYGISITSLQWSHVNTCCFYALLKDGTVISWDLTQSDIYAKVVCENINSCVASTNNLVLLTSDGEVQIHKLTNDQKTKEYVELFKKYVALL
ncbi:hypothetical protein K1T71_014452 [Dendrolimus kikuchii]|uniref:Uncharacterized protein n=1 Tax=Dendrolimus kikuchii TaxID=765133 RepID=A0ACC1CE51_9NEOP|nr:hypothetical protein K1T71_014452 [Dendrolimus kikuchii]